MRRSPPSRSPRRRGFHEALTFSHREIKDLVLAWIALGVAFTLFLNRDVMAILFAPAVTTSIQPLISTFVISLITVGVGFLLHEIAHKIVAVWFGQTAEFKANYGMLGLAIASGLAGFLFAAPGAVYHRGAITSRQNGLIAVAGPLTNLGLAIMFFPLVFLPGFFGTVGNFGVLINLFLAAFNMLPFGPLDGNKVLDWNPAVFGVVFIPSVVLVIAWMIL